MFPYTVKCENELSSLHTSSCGVSQGSVLGRLLFITYTTPLSHLISLFINHLYTDDTQLFFSFHPPNFDSNITHLQNALLQICFWMTTNLLTLNISKTEFLLIGLKQQLAKYTTNCSLNISHSTRNLSFIFDILVSYLLRSDIFSVQILLLSYSSTSLYPTLP